MCSTCSLSSPHAARVKKLFVKMWFTLRVFYWTGVKCEKGMMKSSLWLSTSITTKQFSCLMVSLYAQTQLNHSLTCSSYFSFRRFYCPGRNVCNVCLYTCIYGVYDHTYQCWIFGVSRQNEQLIRLRSERHSVNRRRTAACEMLRWWS